MQKNLNQSFLGRIYGKDRHLFRIILMIIAWSAFMALTKFEKFYTPINFQTMAPSFPEFGLMAWESCCAWLTAASTCRGRRGEPDLDI
jgi:ribose/xylose/arabinose/galactoside ABC-type transport system permease subunit